MFLILEDLILLIFGVNPYFAYQPMVALGSVEMGGIFRDVYSSNPVLASHCSSPQAAGGC